MNFKTNRLEIKPISPDDKEAVLDLLTSETVGKTYMLPDYRSRREAEPLFQRLVALSADESRYVAGVYLDGQFIGMMNDTEIKGKQVEMGYAYLPDYYNRGYATEAFRGAISYLLNHGFESVVAGAFAENPASLRVMIKSGMKKIHRIDEIPYRGKTHTCLYCAIRKEDCHAV